MAPVDFASIHPTRNMGINHEQNRHHTPLISSYTLSKSASVSEYYYATYFDNIIINELW